MTIDKSEMPRPIFVISLGALLAASIMLNIALESEAPACATPAMLAITERGSIVKAVVHQEEVCNVCGLDYFTNLLSS